MVAFVAWWAVFLGATALLVGWQCRLARRRAATWDPLYRLLRSSTRLAAKSGGASKVTRAVESGAAA